MCLESSFSQGFSENPVLIDIIPVSTSTSTSNLRDNGHERLDTSAVRQISAA
jgi:hypothetical protein